ncbi:MAG: hypothetical protein ABIN67_21250 [Ferruginibacter sp.]
MKKLFIIFLLLICGRIKAQELFVFTEPASNMATGSIGLRLNNYFMKDIHTRKYNYHLLPEIMWGVSRKVMVHAEAFMSNADGPLVAEGGSLYLKYRFLSVDDVHNHFRMAAFGKYSFNNSDIHQPAIDFNGHSSGYEVGAVATQLINKVAISASSSLLYAEDNGKEKFLFGDRNRTAINYTLSIGKLMLPKEYTNYKQTNVNLMAELLGQTTVGNGYTYLDLGTSVQFIINSLIRADVGYRFPLVDKLHRTAPRGVVIKLEYNIFNLY